METFNDFLQGLRLTEAVAVLTPAAVYVGHVAVLSFVIFNLYRYMSRRDIFRLDLSRYEQSRYPVLRRTLQVVFYIAKYVLLFPIFAYFWFGLLVATVAFLHKTKPADELLLVAMAVLSSVRVACYYNEDLARDIAKMLPFSLLGVFLIDFGQFDPVESADLLGRLGEHWEDVFYYWVFVVLLELLLRLTDYRVKANYGRFKRLCQRIQNRRRRQPPESENLREDYH